MKKLIDRDDALKEVHKTMYEFFDPVDDDDEYQITYKDKQLLEINKKITQRITALPTADAVDRKDLDKITEAHEEIGYEKGYRDGYAQAIEEASESVGQNTWAGSRISSLANAKMPTADVVERKKGKWIKQYDENCWWYECSECGDYPLKSAYGNDMLSRWCPWCGAEMEGSKDE